MIKKNITVDVKSSVGFLLRKPLYYILKALYFYTTDFRSPICQTNTYYFLRPYLSLKKSIMYILVQNQVLSPVFIYHHKNINIFIKVLYLVFERISMNRVENTLLLLIFSD